MKIDTENKTTSNYAKGSYLYEITELQDKLNSVEKELKDTIMGRVICWILNKASKKEI